MDGEEAGDGQGGREGREISERGKGRLREGEEGEEGGRGGPPMVHRARVLRRSKAAEQGGGVALPRALAFLNRLLTREASLSRFAL